MNKAEIEKIIHDECNLIPTDEAQRAVCLIVEYAEQESREANELIYQV